MGLATNSPLSFVDPALEEVGLLNFFDTITTADEVTHRKPDPEIIQITIQKLKTDPVNTLVFEDQLMGVDAARSAGAQVVAVDNGQHVVFPKTIPVLTWKALLEL